jgi:hypothetical protein
MSDGRDGHGGGAPPSVRPAAATPGSHRARAVTYRCHHCGNATTAAFPETVTAHVHTDHARGLKRSISTCSTGSPRTGSAKPWPICSPPPASVPRACRLDRQSRRGVAPPPPYTRTTASARSVAKCPEPWLTASSSTIISWHITSCAVRNTPCAIRELQALIEAAYSGNRCHGTARHPYW